MDPRLDSSPFGMCGIMRAHGDELIASARMAQEAGIRWNRDDLLWSRIQPTRQTWNWDRYDHGVDALLERGIRSLGLLCYSALWAATGRRDDGKPNITSMPDIEAWRDYVFATVEHFRDRIAVWEMWNEPNNAQFWNNRPSPEAYAKLLVAGSEAAKEADPTCRVMGCNMWAEMPFIHTVFEEGGWEALDIIGLHPYRYPSAPEHTDLVGELMKVAELSDRFGAVKPMWITEIGYATHNGPGGSSNWWAAAALMRIYLTVWSSGLVEKTFWYDFRDDGDDPEYNEHHFGIIHRDWTPKPMIYDGYRLMAETLDGFQPDGSYMLGNDVAALRYCRGADTVLAVWTIGMNMRCAVPVESPRVKAIYPWVREEEHDARNGWVTIQLYATPTFIVPV